MAKENVEKTAETQDVNTKKPDDGKAYLNGVFVENRDKTDKCKFAGFVEDKDGYVKNQKGEYLAKFYLNGVKVSADLIKEDAKPGSTMNVNIEYTVPTSDLTPPELLPESHFKKIRTKDGKEIEDRRNFVLGKDHDATNVTWNEAYTGKDGETHYAKKDKKLINQSIEAAYEAVRDQYRNKNVVKDKAPVRDGNEVSTPEASTPSADKDTPTV